MCNGVGASDKSQRGEDLAQFLVGDWSGQVVILLARRVTSSDSVSNNAIVTVRAEECVEFTWNGILSYDGFVSLSTG